MKKGIVLLIAFLIVCTFLKVRSQDNKLDSLLQLYDNAEHDTTRIQLLFKIGKIYKSQIPDTALYYFYKAIELADFAITTSFNNKQDDNNPKHNLLLLKAKILGSIGSIQRIQGDYAEAMMNLSKALKIFEEYNDKKGMSACYSNIGIVYKNQGTYKKAMEYYLKSFKIDEELGDKMRIASYFNNIGNIYRDKGSYEKAIENLQEALKIYNELGDKRRIAYCYNNIGLVNDDKGNYSKAIEYYLKSLKIREELGDKKGKISCYNNIASLYANQGSYDKAIEYLLLALRMSKELGNKRDISNCYNNIGLIYLNKESYNKSIENFLKSLKIDEESGVKKGISITYSNMGLVHMNQGSYDEALKYYLKALKIDKELGNKDGITLIYINIADLYLRLSETYEQNTQIQTVNLNLTVKYAQKAYELAIDIGALLRQNMAATRLQEAYTKLGRYKEAVKYAEIYITTQDSMFSKEKTKAIAEMTTKYEAEKKQLQIEKMEKQKQLDDKTIEAQQTENRKQQIVIFSAVGGFLIVLVFSIIILRLFRQKQTANILLAKQNKEINQQKDKIEEQNRNITDSIVYAQRIQHALLPPGDYMKQLLPHRFILYKPRDIVSGDFYWVNKKNGLIIAAAADSTGHGVPGAMLSMLGVSILNEVIGSMHKPDAGEILNKFRSKLIDSLHQGGKETNMWDGFDIALCLIDLKKNIVQYAGANCPLYIIRKSELQETKGNKMPIGIHARMEPFTNHNIEIQSGDVLYIFSDGYIDQFGGENDKRFTQRKFKDLLLSIHSKPMTEQKENLKKNLEEWQGKSDQIDDVLVMGVRI